MNTINTSTVIGSAMGAGAITTATTTAGTGAYYISSGSSSLNWNNVQNESVFEINSGTRSLHVKGDAQFDGDIVIGEVSLQKTLEAINQRLAILTPNPELESRWEELKNLAEQYRQLEADILEKEKILQILGQ